MIRDGDYINTTRLSAQEFELAIEAFEKAGAKAISFVPRAPYLGIDDKGYLYSGTAPVFGAIRQISFPYLLALGWEGSGLPPIGATLETSDNSFMNVGELIECIGHKQVKGKLKAVFWNREREYSMALNPCHYRIKPHKAETLQDRLTTFLKRRGCDCAENFARSLIEEGWIKE